MIYVYRQSIFHNGSVRLAPSPFVRLSTKPDEDWFEWEVDGCRNGCDLIGQYYNLRMITHLDECEEAINMARNEPQQALVRYYGNVTISMGENRPVEKGFGATELPSVAQQHLLNSLVDVATERMLEIDRRNQARKERSDGQ